MLVSGVEVKNMKNNDSPFPAILWIVSVCQGKCRLKEKKEWKKERKKNTDKTQTKLNAAYVRYNVKILS